MAIDFQPDSNIDFVPDSTRQTVNGPQQSISNRLLNVLPNVSPQDATSKINSLIGSQPQMLKDAETIPSNFINQLLLNNPRAYANISGVNIPWKAQDSGMHLLGDLAGVAGAMSSPITRIATGTGGLLQKFMSAGAAGAAYAPKDDPNNVIKRLGQGAVSSMIPLAGGGINSLHTIMNPTTEDLVNRAQKLTTEILQPNKGEMVDAITQGKVLPAVEQAAKVIQKSENYGDLTQNINSSIDDIFTKRNDILKGNNFKVNSDYMSPLENLINDTKQRGQATESEIQQMQDVLSREQAFFAKSGDGFDRLGAQDRKEYLQDQTQRLLTKLQTGESIDTQPARTLAMNALRSGLKTSVEGNDPQIASLNSTYGGLLRAKELVAGQNALASKEITPHPLPDMIQKVTGLFFKPHETALDIASENLNSLARKTSKIESLMNKARSRGFVKD